MSRPDSGPSGVSDAYKVDITRASKSAACPRSGSLAPTTSATCRSMPCTTRSGPVPTRATARTIETRALRVEASRDDASRLTLVVPNRDEPVAPTHWSFGQMCSLVGASPSYMRQL